MKNVLILVTVLIIIAGIALFVIPGPAQAPGGGSTTTPQTTIATYDDMVKVSSPLIGASIASPLTITGEARGGWYFEASAPYQLKDASGKVIAEGPIQAQGDWMTSEYVPFSAIITFPTQPSGSKGTLVLKNDNPSGDPKNEKVLEIPVVFK